MIDSSWCDLILWLLLLLNVLQGLLRWIGWCSGTEIGRRHRSGRVRRKAGRLGHVLLPDLADLQLQLLLVLEDVTVGELEVVGGLGRREHAVLLEQLHDQIAPVLEDLPVALLLGRVDRARRRGFGRAWGPVRAVRRGHFFVLFHVKVRPEESVADDVRAGRSGRRREWRTAVGGERRRWWWSVRRLRLLLLLLMLVHLLLLLLVLLVIVVVVLLMLLLVMMIILERRFKLLLLLLLLLRLLHLLLLLLLAVVLRKHPRRRWH